MAVQKDLFDLTMNGIRITVSKGVTAKELTIVQNWLDYCKQILAATEPEPEPQESE